MKLQIFLTADGCETLVKGGTLYSWNFNIRLAEDGTIETPPAHAIFLREVEVSLPKEAAMRHCAEQKLKERLKDIRAEAYVQEKEVQERLQNLLALPAPTAQELDDDIPF